MYTPYHVEKYPLTRDLSLSKGRSTSFLAALSKWWRRWANGSLATPFPVPFSSPMVCLRQSLSSGGVPVLGFADMKSYTGTFWLVHGCSMIPWFGVGVNYSPTGDNLEGQATPEFFATTGQ